MAQSITWGDKVVLANNIWKLPQTDLKDQWSLDTATFLVSKILTKNSADMENGIWVIKQLVELPQCPCAKFLSETMIVQALKTGLTYDNDQIREWSFDIIKIMLAEVPTMCFDILRTDCVGDMINCADGFVLHQLWDEFKTALQVFQLMNVHPCVHYRKHDMKTNIIDLCAEAIKQLIPCVACWPQQETADCVLSIADMLSSLALFEDSFDNAGITTIAKSMTQLVLLSDIWDEDLWGIIKLTLDRRLSLLPMADVRKCIVTLLFRYKISNNYKLKNEVLQICLNFCQSCPLGDNIHDFIPEIGVKWLCRDPAEIWAEKYNNKSANTEADRIKCLTQCCQTLYQLVVHGMAVSGLVIQFGLRCVQWSTNMSLIEAAACLIKAHWTKMTAFQEQKCLKSGIFNFVVNLGDEQNAMIIDDLLYTFLFGDTA